MMENALRNDADRGTVPSTHHGVDQLVVRAPEVLDRDSRAAFRRAALAEVESTLGASPGGRLIVDLSATIRVDSAGLGALIMLQQRAAELRHTVCLRGASEELRFLLVLTRLDDRFEFESPQA
jgi:anti-anti-sigma regulatory factor